MHLRQWMNKLSGNQETFILRGRESVFRMAIQRVPFTAKTTETAALINAATQAAC